VRAGARGMQMALAAWSAEDLRRLAMLFHRMVDDFLAHATDDDNDPELTAPIAGGPSARR